MGNYAVSPPEAVLGEATRRPLLTRWLLAEGPPPCRDFKATDPWGHLSAEPSGERIAAALCEWRRGSCAEGFAGRRVSGGVAGCVAPLQGTNLRTGRGGVGGGEEIPKIRYSGRRSGCSGGGTAPIKWKIKGRGAAFLKKILGAPQRRCSGHLFIISHPCFSY